jgi:uncharacterized protein YjbJ (UPF0337 family)
VSAAVRARWSPSLFFWGAGHAGALGKQNPWGPYTRELSAGGRSGCDLYRPPWNLSFGDPFVREVSMTWEIVMNWDQIKGNWKQFQGKARQQWGKLTDDDWDQVQGQREQLVGRVQERYGIQREEAERQVKDWETGL